MIGKSKLLPLKKFQESENTSAEHLFGCHKWCDPSRGYAAKINEAREKYNTAVAKSAHTTTATSGEEVSLQSPAKVIAPTKYCHDVEIQIHTSTDVCSHLSTPPGVRKNNNTEVSTVATITTTTSGEEVSI